MAAENSDDKKKIETVVAKPEEMEVYIESLESSSRRERQQAGKVIAGVAKVNAEIVAPYSASLVEALDLSEAQTRWECLDALTQIIAVDSRACDKAIPGAEAALFDEDSGPLRLSAMRFLCRLGSTTEKRSEKVWPLIDEGIQCYHGDLEFLDMLVAVIDFSAGKLSPTVKEELADRMRFDSTNGKGLLKKRATQIMEHVS